MKAPRFEKEVHPQASWSLPAGDEGTAEIREATAVAERVSPPVGPVETDDPATLASFYAMRSRVWQTESVAVDPAPDSFAPAARHFIFTRHGDVVAGARLTFHDRLEDTPDFEYIAHLGLGVQVRFAWMSRLVVSPLVRRLGLARHLDAVRIAAAREAGARAVLGQFTSQRESTLSKQGFSVIARWVGGWVGNRPLYVMRLDL
jgi:GNAT superfamily N-acetyltransferase